MVEVRRARIEDAAGIADVHVASWESTYGGVLPDAYLAARSGPVREGFWRDQLRAADALVAIYVACREDGSICGFASGGPELTSRLGVDGELYSLYLLEAAQGKGLGRRLVESVRRDLVSSGAKSILVWVLAENIARGFYECLGGELVAERQVELGGEMVTEVAYDLGPHCKV